MNTTPLPAPSTRARALAGLTALTAIASVALQYALLLQTVGATAGTGQALLRLLGYFTILSNIGVAAVCLARLRGRSDGMAAPAARAAVALYIGITGLVYVLVLRTLWHPQGAQWWADTGLHYAVPVLYLLGWLSGSHGGLRWRQLGAALLFPAVYLGWALLVGRWSGQYPYPFLDLAALGAATVARNALVVGLAFVALGALLWRIDARLGAREAASARR
ncbi:Pr6Pr family membrane protein [Stenotrophomonas sp.]|uniref:Pr6Pr family membrane protein n=1 Tax=Stenotrophomonas sp. TaxID=69392 RepID=UPI0028A224CC|nr:Pr6Pr family membrane protein [Stenotrophomonas sp.]